MLKNLKAFTLSEILIALSVIGVVAALVMPNLVSGHKSTEAKSRFDTAYSLLAKSITDMDADNVSIKPSTYKKVSNSLYPVLKQYHRVTTDCGNYSSQKNESVCIASSSSGQNKDNYKTFNNKTIHTNRFDDGAFVINNGMLIAIENPENGDLWISVDINGKNKLPNRWGWDLFTFELTDEGLLPLGAPGTNATYSTTPLDYCSDSNNSNENGATCGYFAATRDDYFQLLYKNH